MHVVIWDGAGFHPREEDGRRPDNVRLLPLPSDSPALNPVERLWDEVKDRIGNRHGPGVEALLGKLSGLRHTAEPHSPAYWRDASAVLRPAADPWLRIQTNASSAIIIPA